MSPVFSKNFICALLLSAVLIGVSAGLAHAETAVGSSLAHSTPTENSKALDAFTRSEDDLVLVDITVDDVTLMQSVPGYAAKNGLVLPLGQLAEAVEFPIKIAKEGTAKGWFYYEDNRFALDVAKHEVTIGGSTKSFDPAMVEKHNDDIYVDTRLLDEWFKLKTDFNFSTQTVNISPAGEEKLPIQLASEFEKRKARFDNAYREEKKTYPTTRIPYQLAAIPYADVSATMGYDQGQSKSPFSATTSIEATGDLFYMTSDFFVTLDEEDGIDNLRWSLSRRDPEGQIFSNDEAIRHTWLGELATDLKITEVTLGDVFTPALPLTARNQSGRGAYISNRSFDSTSQFDRTALEGDILPNWDVELFRNDELLAYQRAGSDGRYIFTDVPLVSGVNIFRLVFHGPFGETREEIRRINLSNELSKAGQSSFSMGVLQEETALISVRPETSGAVGTDGQNTKGRIRSFFDYEYGITDNLAFFGQLVQMPVETGGMEGFATAGLGASLWGVYGRVDASRSTDGGNALQGSVQTNLYGVTLTGQHQIFDNFISDYTTKNVGGLTSTPGNASATNPLVEHTEARADTPLDLGFLPRLNLGFTGARSIFDDGMEADALTQRLSTSLGRVSLSNNISWENSQGGANPTGREIEGDFTISAPLLWGTLIRGSTRYNIKPETEIESLALAGDKIIDNIYALRGEVTHDLGEDNNLTTFTAGVSRKFEQFQLGLNSSYNTDNQAAVFMNLTFSVGPDPRSPGDWQFFADQTARDGLVSARTYLDRNDNGKYDGGDELVSKASVRSDGGWGTTNDKGTVLLRGQRTTAKSSVELDGDSLINPSWVVKNGGYSVVTRPGTPVMVDFAVGESGSIEGTTYMKKSDGTRDVASNVMLQLLDKTGSMVREERSSFDGYYYFEKVPVGEYTLRVSPNQLQRKELVSSPPVKISIKNEESMIGNIDFDLRDAALPVEVSKEAKPKNKTKKKSASLSTSKG
jgi:hypothetical protein